MPDDMKLASAEVAEEEKPVAAEEVAETESASGADEEEEEQEQPKPKSKGGFQKRIDKLTRRIYELEAEIDKRAASGPEKAATAEEAKKPKMDDFPDLESYVNALSEFNAEQKVSALRQKEAQETAQAQWNDSVQAYNSKLSEVRAEFEDFDEVVGEAVGKIHEQVANAIIEMEEPRLAYHLATHPELVARLDEMSPRRAIAELGKIAASLEKPSPKEKPKSDAPAPIKPVGGTAKSAKPLDQLPVLDYIKQRNKEERERRRSF